MSEKDVLAIGAHEPGRTVCAKACRTVTHPGTWMIGRWNWSGEEWQRGYRKDD